MSVQLQHLAFNMSLESEVDNPSYAVDSWLNVSLERLKRNKNDTQESFVMLNKTAPRILTNMALWKNVETPRTKVVATRLGRPENVEV
jgi:hypothetical protein